jgi:hypothetical protein
MTDPKKIAETADMIINGYAFTRSDDNVRVLNLNSVGSAAVIGKDNEVIETSMDDIELDIVMNYYKRNKAFLED